ncbi:MAG: hypothetical protein H0X17_18720, partial [Deltaproteobacteria bacterium]|nr:hypothetical protein [Deltaproteobacteria bacterium]
MGSTRPGRALPRKCCRRSCWSTDGSTPRISHPRLERGLQRNPIGPGARETAVHSLVRSGCGWQIHLPKPGARDPLPDGAAWVPCARVKVHLIGIGGTGMGAVAGLLAEAGHEVRGSDAAVYPPMSEQLAALGVPVMMPYAPDNLAWTP